MNNLEIDIIALTRGYGNGIYTIVYNTQEILSHMNLNINDAKNKLSKQLGCSSYIKNNNIYLSGAHSPLNLRMILNGDY